MGENIRENEKNNVSREGRRGRGYKATKIVTLNIQGLLNGDKYKVKQLNDIAEDLYDELQKFSGALEEGTRNVLAECLGRTVVAKPSLCRALLKGSNGFL